MSRLPPMGLSPRVRGNRDLFHGSGMCRRSIPRVCGGTIIRVVSPAPPMGLSPRVRGNRSECSISIVSRSIPACAGEPCHPHMVRSARVSGLSPRVRGKHPVPSRPSSQGLSPRVRGNHQRGVYTNVPHGSIPACAGEPEPSRASTSRRQVYPRVCGGTTVTPIISISVRGLSQRVRGNPEPTHGLVLVLWSIPACAGEPRFQMQSRRTPRVYPRVCGGTLSENLFHILRMGLSPRVRGNRAGITSRRDNCRVYPSVCGGTPAADSRGVVVTGLSVKICEQGLV